MYIFEFLILSLAHGALKATEMLAEETVDADHYTTALYMIIEEDNF